MMAFEFLVPNVPEAPLYTARQQSGLLRFMVGCRSEQILHIMPALGPKTLESDYLDSNSGSNMCHSE